MKHRLRFLLLTILPLPLALTGCLLVTHVGDLEHSVGPAREQESTLNRRELPSDTFRLEPSADNIGFRLLQQFEIQEEIEKAIIQRHSTYCVTHNILKEIFWFTVFDAVLVLPVFADFIGDCLGHELWSKRCRYESLELTKKDVDRYLRSASEWKFVAAEIEVELPCGLLLALTSDEEGISRLHLTGQQFTLLSKEENVELVVKASVSGQLKSIRSAVVPTQRRRYPLA